MKITFYYFTMHVHERAHNAYNYARLHMVMWLPGGPSELSQLSSGHIQRTIYHISYLSLQRNTFQVVVASNSHQSFIIFNYNRLQWTTGDASRGRNGFGGTSARAGINGGYGVNAITLFGSGSRSLMHKTRDTNCGLNGVFVLAPSRTGKYSTIP